MSKKPSLKNLDETVISKINEAETNAKAFANDLIQDLETKTQADNRETEIRTYIDENLDNTTSTEISLNRGNKVLNVDRNTPVNVLNFTGKTVINYAPLFDSGMWVIDAKATVTTPSVLTLNSTGDYQASTLTINAKTNTMYTISMIRSGRIDVQGWNDSTYVERYYQDTVGINSPEGLVKYTFTTGATISRIMIVLTNMGVGTFVFKEISLNEGSTAKEFVANVKGVTNPTIEVRGSNLFKGFDSGSLIKDANAVITSPNKLTLITSTNGSSSYIIVPTKINTDYVVSIKHNAKIGVYKSDMVTAIVPYTSAQTMTFNSGTNTELRIFMSNDTLGVGTFTFEDVMLNEGSTAKPFEPYRSTSQTFVGTFHEGETPTVENGQAKVLRKKKEIVLDGSLLYGVQQNNVGNKNIQITGFPHKPLSHYSHAMVKYNGSLLTQQAVESYATEPNRYIFKTDSYVTISIANTDSGWGETYTPTQAEIQAYFLGWKMYAFDTSLATNPYTGTGRKGWVKLDTTQLNGYLAGSGVEGLAPTTKSDNKNWQPYRLIYDLATPVPETVKTIGSLRLAEGDNTLELTEGRIVRERAKTAHVSHVKTWVINSTDFPSEFKFKTGNILRIYKNGVEDTLWRVFSDSYAYGIYRADIHESDFDTTAIYTVDYIPLEPYKVSAHANPITINYRDTLGGVTEELVTDVSQLESRLNGQQSVIDEVLRDAPVYAKKTQEKWKTVVLQNGWGGSLQYKKDDFGNVILKGVLNTVGTTVSGATFGTLPVGYRPLNAVMPVLVTRGNTSPYDASPLFTLVGSGEIIISHNQSLPTVGTTLAGLYFEVTYSAV